MVFPPFLPLGTTHTGLKSSCPPSPHSESCVFRRRRDGGGGEGGFEGLSSSLSFSPSEPACAALCSLPPSPCSTLFSFLPLLQLAPNENGKRRRSGETDRGAAPPVLPPLPSPQCTLCDFPFIFAVHLSLLPLFFDYGHWPIPRVCADEKAHSVAYLVQQRCPRKKRVVSSICTTLLSSKASPFFPFSPPPLFPTLTRPPFLPNLREERPTDPLLF